MKDLSKKFKFPKEVLFQKALVGLLSKMPNIREVQELHGPLENGKDIVFKSTGPFERTINSACIVKNTKIVGQVSSNNAAHVVLEQAKQALYNTYKDNSGTELKIHHVYVISSEHISPQAIESIKGQLYEKAGQITFISGEQVIVFFQQHWADFLADEATAIEKYTKEFQSTLEIRKEILKLAELYPNYLNEIHAFHYLPTGFRLILQNHDIDIINDGLPSIDYFKGSFPSADISEINEKIEKKLYFLKYLRQWGYLTDEEIKKFLDLANNFMYLLRKGWAEGEVDEEKTNNSDIYGSDPIKFIMIKNSCDVTRALIDIQKLLSKSIEMIKKDLSKSYDLYKQNLIEHTNLSNNKQLLDYLTAIDCLEACKFLISGNKKNNVLREYTFENNDLRRIKGLFLVTGPAGYGKTSYCRWSALEDIRAWKAQEDSHLPIYIKLNTINSSNLQGEKELLTAGLSTALLSNEDWYSVMEGKFPVRLYLDGLDELSNYSLREKVVLLAKQISISKPDWQIIITTRDYLRTKWLSNTVRIELKGFSIDKVREFADKMLSNQKHTSEQFMKQLNDKESLIHLSRVPLLSTLMVLVFKNTGSLPQKRTSLYSIFIELLCGGWDLAKGFQRQVKYGSELKVAVLIRLAILSHQNKRRYFNIDLYYHACLCAAPSLFNNKIDQMEFLLDELVIDGLLDRSGKILNFTHLSFQEFLVARGFSINVNSDDAQKALIEYLEGDDWWQEVLFFLIGLGSDPEYFADWIKSSVMKCLSDDVQIREQRLYKELNDLFSWKVASR